MSPLSHRDRRPWPILTASPSSRVVYRGRCGLTVLGAVRTCCSCCSTMRRRLSRYIGSVGQSSLSTSADCQSPLTSAFPVSSAIVSLTRCVLYWSTSVKLAFHDADTDTDADTDSPNKATVLRPTHAISSRGSSRECRRVVQLATGITSIARVVRVGDDDTRVGVGAVEFQLNYIFTLAESSTATVWCMSVNNCRSESFGQFFL